MLMNFLRNMFSKKENTPDSYTYSDFWKWFANNEKNFFSSVKSRENIETEFFDKLAPELNKLGYRYYFLTGMKDEHTAELIDRKSTRLNSSHVKISYAVFC